MNALKVTAGVLALADSVVGLYLSSATSFPSNLAIFQALLLWASAFLFVDSLLCIYGVHYAFPAAAALGAALAADSPLILSGYTLQEVVLLALSLIGLILNVLAFRSTSQLSEQANPMNLPVFG
jgi:hypothetical protein